jgi:hypothetical protein
MPVGTHTAVSVEVVRPLDARLCIARRVRRVLVVVAMRMVWWRCSSFGEATRGDHPSAEPGQATIRS